MGISYNGLWKLLIDKGLNKTQFRDLVNISNGTLARFSKNEYVSISVLENICRTLGCQFGDIIEYTSDDNK